MNELLRAQYIDGMDYQPVFYKAAALAFPEAFQLYEGYFAPKDPLGLEALSLALDYSTYSDIHTN